jgi:hypothetical protein
VAERSGAAGMRHTEFLARMDSALGEFYAHCHPAVWLVAHVAAPVFSFDCGS